jgi:hypothetical protein
MSKNLIKVINKKSSFKFPWLVIIVSIAILLSLYISQASMMVKATSLVEDYENEIEKIWKQNKDLEITFSRKNSLKNSESLLEELNFEKVTKIDYIRILETSVAAK